MLSNNINLYLHLLLTKISNIMPFIIMLLMIVAACVVGFYTDNIFTATFIISEIICFLLFIIARVKEMNYLDVIEQDERLIHVYVSVVREVARANQIVYDKTYTSRRV